MICWRSRAGRVLHHSTSPTACRRSYPDPPCAQPQQIGEDVRDSSKTSYRASEVVTSILLLKDSRATICCGSSTVDSMAASLKAWIAVVTQPAVYTRQRKGLLKLSKVANRKMSLLVAQVVRLAQLEHHLIPYTPKDDPAYGASIQEFAYLGAGGVVLASLAGLDDDDLSISSSSSHSEVKRILCSNHISCTCGSRP